MPKIRSFTILEKLEVIAWHKARGCNVSLTSRNFKVDRKSIRDWISKENLLQQNNYGQQKRKRKLGSGRRPLSEELDDELFDFLRAERESGRAVSTKLLKEQAMTIATTRLGLMGFKASSQFIRNWKNRFNVSMRKGTNDGQKTPEMLFEAVEAFRNILKEKRRVSDYTMYNICNMDQTMVRFDQPATRTNNVKGESSIRITNTGSTKRGFTVALAAHASGHKMPALCIFKEPSGRIPPKVLQKLVIPSNVKVTSSSNGWMTGVEFEEWIRRIWGGNTDDVRRLLVLDMAPIHRTKQAAELLNNVDTDIVFIPGGCTSFLQPADVSWNKPFKDGLKKSWAKFMTAGEKTPKGNLKRPNRQHMVTWIGKAWEAVTEEVIIKSFKSCGLSTALDGSENGLFNSKLCDAVASDSNELVEDSATGNLLFNDNDSDSDESFAGFSSEDD